MYIIFFLEEKKKFGRASKPCTLISKSKGPYVVEEIGSDHNQNLKTALKLIDVAKKINVTQ